jgi:predicted Fe-Mo cluster-binding NifX family protein
VEQVISGDFGPKAKNLLEKLKIQMIVPENRNNTVQEVLDQFIHNSN